MNVVERIGSAVRSNAAQWRSSTGWAYYLPRTRLDYQRETGQGLRSSVVVAVVGWIARNLPAAPLRLRGITNDPADDPTDVVPEEFGAGAMLSLMRRPNLHYDGITLLKAMAVDYNTTGNVYILKVRNGAGRPVELWWLPSTLVEPRWPQYDPSVFISHYEYNPNGIPLEVPVADMIHVRNSIDPVNVRKGLAPIASLAREVYTDDEAAAFTATVLSNLGVPGVIVSPETSTVPGANQIRDVAQVKQTLRESFTGDKRGDFAVFSAPTRVQVLSWSPEQLQLRDLRRIPEERVSGVTGVPAIVAGLGAGLDRSTFANFAEARAMAYEENIIPTQAAWAEALTWQLLADFADPLKFILDFDTSNIRALQEDQNTLWSRNLDAYKAAAIDRRTFKRNVGLPNDELDDVYAIPFNVAITSSLQPPPPIKEVEEEPVPEPGGGSEPPAGPATNGHTDEPIAETVPLF